MARPQAWRRETSGLAQDTSRDRRETPEIRALDVTASNVADAPMLPGSPDQAIATVTADGACDTRRCRGSIADRGAAAFRHSPGPVAFMPSLAPRRNAKPRNPATAGAGARNEALRASRYLGRALWRRWHECHRRRRVEPKMSCVRGLGQRLVARDFDRRVAEVQVRAAVPNRFTAPGIPVTVPAG